MSNEVPPPSQADILVGREEEVRQLARALLPATGYPRPVVITGAAGLGKTSLVAAFAAQHVEHFLGGYLQLSTRDVPADDRALATSLAERLGLPLSPDSVVSRVRERLLAPRTLLHLEDVDARPTALAVAALLRQLHGCAVVATGRFEALGAGHDWEMVRLGPLGPDAALELLARVYRPTESAAEASERQSLVAVLGGAPLALPTTFRTDCA